MIQIRGCPVGSSGLMCSTEVYIRRVKKDVDLFFIDMWRADIAISGSNAVDLEKYDLSFYIDPEKGEQLRRSRSLRLRWRRPSRMFRILS
jgi:hypothetical protein